MVLFVYNQKRRGSYNLISVHKRHRKKYDIRVLYIYYIGLLSGFLRLLTLYSSFLGYAIHVLRLLAKITLLYCTMLYSCYTPPQGEARTLRY